MKKANKKKLSLSKATIKQLTEVTGGAATICTFGSTAKEPSVFQPTCLPTCEGDFTCHTSYPCI